MVTKEEYIFLAILAMLFVCSLQMRFQSKVIPICFVFLDQGTKSLNNLNSGRCLCDGRIKITAIVLSRLIEILHFVNRYSRSDVGR
jgi:hypothetical protein